MKTILVTGGLGFIGSNFIRYVLENHNIKVINIDCLTYAGNIKSLGDIYEKYSDNYAYFNCSIGEADLPLKILRNFEVDSVVNFAAETHVGKSINNSLPFIQTNIWDTYFFIETCREYWESLDKERQENFKFIQTSTDEVFGHLTNRNFLFNESSPYNPRNPYSATKAAADHLINSWYNTYKFPGIIVHSVNNYGPWQTNDKLIPKIIYKYLREEKFPLEGDGRNFREWIYVQDNVVAIFDVLRKGNIGENYCISSNQNYSNSEVIQSILVELDSQTNKFSATKYENFIEQVEDRKGHDFGYALDNFKIKNELGWAYDYNFLAGIKQTVKWYLENQHEIFSENC